MQLISQVCDFELQLIDLQSVVGDLTVEVRDLKFVVVYLCDININLIFKAG